MPFCEDLILEAIGCSAKDCFPDSRTLCGVAVLEGNSRVDEDMNSKQ